MLAEELLDWVLCERPRLMLESWKSATSSLVKLKRWEDLQLPKTNLTPPWNCEGSLVKILQCFRHPGNDLGSQIIRTILTSPISDHPKIVVPGHFLRPWNVKEAWRNRNPWAGLHLREEEIFHLCFQRPNQTKRTRSWKLTRSGK